MVLAFASISQAQVMYAWHYDGVADGTALNGAGNTGSTGSLASVKWNNKATAVVSNEMQRWEANGSLASSFVTKPLGGAATGKYELSYDVPSVDFANTAAIDGTANAGYGIRGAGSGNSADHGMRIRYEGGLNVTNYNIVAGVTNAVNIYADADQVQIQVKSEDLGASFGANQWQTVTNILGSSAANINLRCEYDADTRGTIGSFKAYYTIGAGPEVLAHTGAIDAGWVNSTIRQQIQHTNGGTSWQIGDVITFDNIKVTQLAAAEPFPAVALVDLWDYDSNTNGASMSEGVSTGYVGGAAFSDSNLAAISNNMLRFAYDGVEQSIFRVTPVSGASGMSTGKFELAWDYVSIDFANTEAAVSNANVGINIRDTVLAAKPSVGFRVQYNGTANEMNLQLTDGAGANQTLASLPGSSLSNLHVRLQMDLDNSGSAGSVNMFYTLDGEPEVPLTYGGAVPAGFQLSEYRLVVQTINGGNGWQLGDAVYTDNLRFDKIAAIDVAPVYLEKVVYQMNDVAGTLLNALAQTGTDGGQIQGTDPLIATDGLGSLVSMGDGTNDVTRKHFLDIIYAQGLHRLEFAFDDFNLDASENSSSLKFGLVDDSGTNLVNFGIDVNTNNAAARFRASANNGGGAGQDFYDYGYVASTGVVLRIDVNLDIGTYSASWRFDNGTEFTSVASGESLGQLANIAEIRLSVNAGDTTGFDAADYINVDYLIYSTTSTELPPTATELWNAWLGLYPGLGTSTNFSDDFDGDTLDNVREYAHGGSPVDGGDVGNAPALGATSNVGGTNYIDYVFIRRQDMAARGLSYTVKVNDDLVFGSWTNDSSLISFKGAVNIDDTWRAVTNSINSDAAERFIKTDVKLTL